MAIDLARVQAHPKPCGIADLPAWNGQRSFGSAVTERSAGSISAANVIVILQPSSRWR